MKFCPYCGATLVLKEIEDRERECCPQSGCRFVHWNSPVPVVAGIIETEHGVVLAHNKAWPPGIYSMIAGYLEAGESPEDAIIRETWEELGLTAREPNLVGTYTYPNKNQLILAYHLFAEGEIVLNEELDDYKLMTKKTLAGWPFGQDALPGWPFGAGTAITDWLKQ